MTAEIFGASFLQESLFLSAKDGESAVNVGVVLELLGPLDIPRLVAAIGRLASRHEALRTTLTGVDGKVWQVVAPSAKVPAAVLDLSAEHDPEAEAMRLVKDHLRRPFALQGPSLCRVMIITCGPGKHFLSLSLHHAVIDGWSASVLAAELRACYCETGAGPIAAPMLQPADYAAWERQPADSASLDGWRRQLRGYSTRLRIPGATGPGPEQLSQAHELPDGGAGASGGVERLARQLRVPVVAVLAAAVAASLREYAGDGTLARDSGLSEPGLIVGLVRANRERAELRDVVGYLADIAPLTIDLRGDPEFGGLVDRTAAALAYSRDHPVPLAALSRLLRADGGEGPLFDVCLNYLPGARLQDQVSGELLMARVDVKDKEPSASRWWGGTALIDYVLRSASPGQLSGCVRGDLNTLPSSLLADLADRFWTALVGGTESPDLRVSELAASVSQATLWPSQSRPMCGRPICSPSPTWKRSGSAPSISGRPTITSPSPSASKDPSITACCSTRSGH
ncbi:MAG TPA: condensation domain-containing protein [Trebonia sp.]